ncbi:hypothetical protein LP419_29530 [Massilia sp. H-1]|nr:hypothetical protein LP419_29530 [Massilia sp. H-1]
MRVHELRCFGASAGKGNVAMVVEDGPDQTAERQAFAVAQGRTSVFLTGTAQIEADFYYPHARSPCACMPPWRRPMCCANAADRRS